MEIRPRLLHEFAAFFGIRLVHRLLGKVTRHFQQDLAVHRIDLQQVVEDLTDTGGFDFSTGPRALPLASSEVSSDFERLVTELGADLHEKLGGLVRESRSH